MATWTFQDSFSAVDNDHLTLLLCDENVPRAFMSVCLYCCYTCTCTYMLISSCYSQPIETIGIRMSSYFVQITSQSENLESNISENIIKHVATCELRFQKEVPSLAGCSLFIYLRVDCNFAIAASQCFVE